MLIMVASIDRLSDDPIIKGWKEQGVVPDDYGEMLDNKRKWKKKYGSRTTKTSKN